jgi:hypothetical protein
LSLQRAQLYELLPIKSAQSTKNAYHKLQLKGLISPRPQLSVATMNETKLPASSMVPDTSSTEFSRANLFGMFVTLQLCQLTQPYGSLLFRGSSGFFWRVNPIASFVEALIIAYYLLKTIWQAWREELEMTQWGKKLRTTASALLLLRGALEDEDGGLMGKLMAASFFDGAQYAETRPEIDGMISSGADTGQEAAETMPAPGQMPGINESYEMGPITTQNDSHNPQTVTPQQGVLRRRTSQLESASVRRTNAITGPDPSSEKSRLLRAAFGPNALAHREMRIDIVTAVSVLVIFVKLLAIRSLWVFLTAAYFIVFGWLLVQSLLLIFHFRELSDLDMASSIRTARLLDAALKESSRKYQFLYVALHAPFLGYICYALAFQLELPPWLQWFSRGVEIFFAIAAQCVLYICFFGVIVGVPLSLLLVLAGVVSLAITPFARLAPGWTPILQGRFETFNSLRLVLYGLLGSLGSLLLLWLGLGLLTYYSKALIAKDGTYEPLFGNSALGTTLDSGLMASICSVWTIILFCFLLLIFCGVLLPHGAGSQNRVSWGNFIITVISFIYYLITYDQQGSSKPAWTEWLG